VRRILTDILSRVAQRRSLNLRQRKFGDTESWELRQDQRAVFSFQISARTVRLEPYLASPWPPLQIESLADNVGLKDERFGSAWRPARLARLEGSSRCRFGFTPGLLATVGAEESRTGIRRPPSWRSHAALRIGASPSAPLDCRLPPNGNGRPRYAAGIEMFF